MSHEVINHLYSIGKLAPLDVHFAELMVRLNKQPTPEVELAAAMTSWSTRQGHICLDLTRPVDIQLMSSPDIIRDLDLAAWRHKLVNSRIVGHPGEYKPLILDPAGRLYLYRYWEYQLADALKARIDESLALPETNALRVGLARLFPTQGSEVDLQKVAAFAAVSKKFCVISGGPGTGKTTTVAKILALLVESSAKKDLRPALAAPTGKAAARLQEAIKLAKQHLNCSDQVKQAIPETASTLHRLLGSLPGSPFFRHNESNLLHLDVLVVDEASMVDLALMSKLLQALHPDTRLILLGDKDQLSSVEAGAVLGEICGCGEPERFSQSFAAAYREICGCRLDRTSSPEVVGQRSQDCIIQLQKSYRFAEDSGIAVVSRAVGNNDADTVVAAFKEGKYPDLVWADLQAGEALPQIVKLDIVKGYRGYLEEVKRLRSQAMADSTRNLQKIFNLFDEFRILCAVREGPYGVAGLNLLTETLLEEAGLLRRDNKWYSGRPALIRRNDYNLGLFNGDVGIYLPDMVAGSDSRAVFPGSQGAFRLFHPLRLPVLETVFAMTVHQSQGSEFDEILLILPDQDSPVLTRELLYTAITRARRKVTLWSSEHVLRLAMARATERISGLSDALWGCGQV
ncbi:MAG: exodeoxyribonuclease V subunit alpha [Deltaproteobacteria bacterium]|nr:exodeoxyribonuclease V subunit alpha [Deltaproteobacteria bacterium]